MQQYRKLPIVIEAIQFTGDVTPFETLIPCGKYHDDGTFSIETLEGLLHVSLGDYVVKGVMGEFYPVKEDIFKTTYEFIPAGSIEQPSIKSEFTKELSRILNRYCLDSQANTPDFLLAEYLVSCLDAQRTMVKEVVKHQVPLGGKICL
jgi:hypothetical protein